MSTKRIIARNAMWNWMGLATQMMAGFLIMPFLIHTLGAATYGLWLIISSLTTYFGAVDLGVSGSVGRNVAYCRAKNDLDGVNGIVNTAAAYLFGVAWLVLAATFVAMEALVHLVPDVPPAIANEVDLAVFLVGLNLALTLPLSAFDGVLWAYQRFDLQNVVDIPIVIVRTVLAFWLMADGGGLVTLALLVLTTHQCGSMIKVILAFREVRGLRISWRLVNKQRAKTVFSYSMWYYPLSLSRGFISQVSLGGIGASLGTVQVTLYNIAHRLTGYANSFLIAGTHVLTPAATAMHARDQKHKQQWLMVEGGKVCLVFALFFFSLFVFLGRSLIHLWVGPGLDEAYPVLLVLALGEIIPMSQWITYGMILGKGKHKALALSSMVELGLVAFFATMLSKPFGLLAVCAGIACSTAMCRGLFQCLYGCRLAEVAPTRYLRQAVLPAIVIASGPALALGFASQWHSPLSWLMLVAFGITYSVVYFAVAVISILGVDHIRKLILSSRYFRPKTSVIAEYSSVVEE